MNQNHVLVGRDSLNAGVTHYVFGCLVVTHYFGDHYSTYRYKSADYAFEIAFALCERKVAGRTVTQKVRRTNLDTL